MAGGKICFDYRLNNNYGFDQTGRMTKLHMQGFVKLNGVNKWDIPSVTNDNNVYLIAWVLYV